VGKFSTIAAVKPMNYGSMHITSSTGHGNACRGPVWSPGKGELPHLDLMLGIERLCGFQWQPGDGRPMADG
jgi:hypothetical protein